MILWIILVIVALAGLTKSEWLDWTPKEWKQYWKRQKEKL